MFMYKIFKIWFVGVVRSNQINILFVTVGYATTTTMATLEGTSLLKLSNSENLNKFLHDCVDDLIGRIHEDVDNYSSDIEWTKSEHQRARNLIQNLYKQNALGNEDVFTPKFNELSLKDVEEIKQCFYIRKSEIYQAVIKDKLLRGGHPLVENIDWKLKWIMGSSKVVSISEPLLQVDLHCLKENDVGGRSTVNFEMDLQLLDKFISELENAKANL